MPAMMPAAAAPTVPAKRGTRGGGGGAHLRGMRRAGDLFVWMWGVVWWPRVVWCVGGLDLVLDLK